MSDLRERLLDAGRRVNGWRFADVFVAAFWPIIEAELQKRDKEIERLEWVKNDHWVKVQNWSDRAVKAETALPEANKLLEQTIEVLERLEPILEDGDAMYHEFYRVAKPLLDNLKALKKEATE